MNAGIRATSLYIFEFGINNLIKILNSVLIMKREATISLMGEQN
jgi:hypothetical protein